MQMKSGVLAPGVLEAKWLLKSVAAVLTAIVCLGNACNEPVRAQAAQMFAQKCSACHTIGKGRLVGPDLAVCKDKSEQEVTAAVKRMQQMAGPLSASEIADMVKFLRQPGAATQSKELPPEPVKAAGVEKTATKDSQPAVDLATAAGSVERGHRLFNGEQGLANGGVSCIACHQAQGNGGTLGPDLSKVAEKMPSSALVSAIETAPFKVMKDAYASHPITKPESVDLAKYLESIKGKTGQRKEISIGWIGMGGAVALIAAIALGYRNRKGSARERLSRRKF